MKNKLVFRILGALASALIIIAVFVPFVNVKGYSPSLWETYEVTKALYLPIMIIVFGAIGIIFFSLNIKTEFAYMSVGAVTFFVVMQTIDILDQGVFNTLSIGYYCLVIGTVLMGIMAFLTNLRSNKKVQINEEIKIEQPSMLEQMNNLYNEQIPNQIEISPIQPVNIVVQPLQYQLSQSVPPVQEFNQVVEPVISSSPQPMNPVVQEFNVPIVEQQQNVQPVVMQDQNVVAPVVNPVVQEFNVPIVEQQQNVQPVVMQDQNEITTTLNPVVQEFVGQSTPMKEENVAIQQPINPVVQEFNNPGASPVQQQNSNEFDIFGQPINKS